jgi:hypothetical protein
MSVTLDRLLCTVVALLSILLTSCNRPDARVIVDAGAFHVVREPHHYFNEYAKTIWYSYKVKYRGDALTFASKPDQDVSVTYTDKQIEHLYILSDAPAALLVESYDGRDHRRWSLLVDSAQGLRVMQVAFGDHGDPLNRLDELRLDRGRWLWVREQTLIDRQALRVYPLAVPERADTYASFVQFSPDHKHMARKTWITNYAIEPATSRHVIMDNEIATGQFVSYEFDAQAQPYRSWSDVDAAWLNRYFAWQSIDGVYRLQRRATALP